LPSPPRSPKAAPKLTPFWSRPHSALTSFELQVAQVPEGEVGLDQHGAVEKDPDALRGGLGPRIARALTSSFSDPVEAVGHEEVQAPVVVQVLEAHGPGPVRGGDPREEGALERSGPCPCSDRGRCGGTSAPRRELSDSSSRSRGGMEFWSFWWVVAAMSATRRSMSPSLFTSPRSEPIEEKDVCGQHLVDHVRERAVPVVAVELVRDPVVVGDVEVGPAVVVEVPPGRRVALGLAGDARALGHVRERAVSVVVEEVAALAARVRGRCPAGWSRCRRRASRRGRSRRRPPSRSSP
jgi:hypothetical protein